MFDYLKHLYGELAGDILTKWQAAYPALAKAGLALLGALLIWAIFKRFMKRVRKKIDQNESVVIHDQVFDLLQRAVSYVLILGSGIYLLNVFKIPALEKVFYAALIIFLALPVKSFTIVLLSYFHDNPR
ncbi:MAG: hypothetical protein JRF69_11935 [Deltaproteobacteria bacterium]|nr:hypothetical protein [Deltaproteobacteria bacterium]